MCISNNGYNVLNSIDLTNFLNALMCFLMSCSNRGGQVSPVRTMALRRILLSSSSCVQFRIMWLIVCSSFSPQGHFVLGIILNLWRYDLVKPWPVTMAVNSAEIGIAVLLHLNNHIFRGEIMKASKNIYFSSILGQIIKFKWISLWI